MKYYLMILIPSREDPNILSCRVVDSRGSFRNFGMSYPNPDFVSQFHNDDAIKMKRTLEKNFPGSIVFVTPIIITKKHGIQRR